MDSHEASNSAAKSQMPALAVPGINDDNANPLTLDFTSGATRLLEKRRQMFEVQEALEAQKEEFSRREDAFRRREEALRRKDLELQESLIKFNKFLQENESKRSRAIKRQGDEQKQRKEKEVEIARLQQHYEWQKDRKEKVKKREEENKRYQTFLSATVDYASKEYNEIDELLSRYRVLKLANEDLMERQASGEKEYDTKYNEYADYCKDAVNDELNCSNDIAQLKKKMEKVQIYVDKKENDIELTVKEKSNQALELWQILSAVENILTRSEQGLRTKVSASKKQMTQQYNNNNNNNNNKRKEGIDGGFPGITGAGGEAIEGGRPLTTSTNTSSGALSRPPTTSTATSSQGKNANIPTSMNLSSAATYKKPQTRLDLEVEGKKAIQRLDLIAIYMSDFLATVKEYNG